MAMAYLYQTLGDEAFTLDYPVGRLLPQDERTLFAQMLRRGINSPLTSSCGRLFDAVAALLNIRHYVSYDGQGAIELEALAETDELNSPSLRTSNRYEDGVTSAVNIGTSPPLFFHGGSYRYSIIIDEKQPLQLDFSPMFTEIIADLYADRQTSTIAYRFHQTVASVTVDVCLRVASSTGVDRVVLSGGVFQNRLLSKMVYSALSDKGLQVFTHRLVPPNDGGIALGQAVIAGRRKG
jgi:hydrogenase maturation protein HypF